MIFFLSAFLQFFDFVVDFFDFLDFLVWEGRGERFFHFFVDFFFTFIFVLGERESFFCFFHVFFVFSDHCRPAPLLTHTTFGPHRLLASFFDQTVLCLNLCEPSLTPKKPWPALREFVAHVLFFWAMDLPARGPLPKTTLCGIPCCCCCCCCCCVVLCCVVVWCGVLCCVVLCCVVLCCGGLVVVCRCGVGRSP